MRGRPFSSYSSSRGGRNWMAYVKSFVLAAVLLAIVFGISHSHGVLGVTAVGIQGLGFAFLAWYCRGLEASSAAHAANNLSVFVFSGLGLSAVGSGGIEAVFISSGIMLLYCVCVVLLDRKFNWFTSQGDGVTAFNNKYGLKAA